METPKGWRKDAHRLWAAGKKNDAIQVVLGAINTAAGKKPASLVLQLGYYVFLVGDPKAAAGFMERGLADHPDHIELLLNAGICWSRANVHDRAVLMITRYLAAGGKDPVAHDTLCKCFAAIGKYEEARNAGEAALRIKDAAAGVTHGWSLPAGKPGDWAERDGKSDVIAFSLFGSNPRYLRGALDNALAASRLYHRWRLRFHVDDTVPADLRHALARLGCELVEEPAGQTMRQRLGWRFKVANDPAVGRFLVRDVDSVVNERERGAVEEWIASDRWFHVMRDWWTHTDLILAGMWGGIAGVLPPLAPMLARYRPRAAETLNIDQWFLRDELWRYVRQSCMVHDRCFTLFDARAWPGTAPQGNTHVGQDVFAAKRAEQEERLTGWLEEMPSLAAPPRPASTRADKPH